MGFCLHLHWIFSSPTGVQWISPIFISPPYSGAWICWGLPRTTTHWVLLTLKLASPPIFFTLLPKLKSSPTSLTPSLPQSAASASCCWFLLGLWLQVTPQPLCPFAICQHPQRAVGFPGGERDLSLAPNLKIAEVESVPAVYNKQYWMATGWINGTGVDKRSQVLNR